MIIFTFILCTSYMGLDKKKLPKKTKPYTKPEIINRFFDYVLKDFTKLVYKMI